MTVTLEHSPAPDVRTVLAEELRAIAGRPLVQVPVFPIRDERDGGSRLMWTVLALDADGREVPLPGRVIRVVNLLRRAFPLAPWGRAQRYRVRSGALTKYTPPANTPGRGPR